MINNEYIIKQHIILMCAKNNLHTKKERYSVGRHCNTIVVDKREKNND